VVDHDEIHAARFADLDSTTLYRLLALRSEIFVVEQECAYQDLDGRDLEPSARQLWIERDGEIVATLRLLVDDDGAARIGRVATKVDARGTGVAARLMRHALEVVGDDPVVLDAQAYLHDWYARFGFVRDGDDFLEDGIPHIPMRLAH
jgi:ElaA protein